MQLCNRLHNKSKKFQMNTICITGMRDRIPNMNLTEIR